MFLRNFGVFSTDHTVLYPRTVAVRTSNLASYSIIITSVSVYKKYKQKNK
jgi:hypothetical protein